LNTISCRQRQNTKPLRGRYLESIEETHMTTINFGDRNNIVKSLNVSSDVITFGNGQADRLLLNGDDNTVTLGNGNRDSATVSGQFDDITLGNGNQDAVAVSGFHDNVTVGNGNQDMITANGAVNVNVRLGDGNGDTVNMNDGNENNVFVGNGNGDTVNVKSLNTFVFGGNGHGDTLNINGDVAEVFGGQGNTINLSSNTLALIGCNDPMLFISAGYSPIIFDQSTGLQLNIGPTTGSILLSNFDQDLGHGVIDLTGGVGGFTNPSAVLAALAPDGNGGTLLSFGSGSSLDIHSVLPSALTAANFKIG
jgi:hypothetical protein